MSIDSIQIMTVSTLSSKNDYTDHNKTAVWTRAQAIHNESYSDSWTYGTVNMLAATKNNYITS